MRNLKKNMLIHTDVLTNFSAFRYSPWVWIFIWYNLTSTSRTFFKVCLTCILGLLISATFIAPKMLLLCTYFYRMLSKYRILNLQINLLLHFEDVIALYSGLHWFRWKVNHKSYFVLFCFCCLSKILFEIKL